MWGNGRVCYDPFWLRPLEGLLCDSLRDLQERAQAAAMVPAGEPPAAAAAAAGCSRCCSQYRSCPGQVRLLVWHLLLPPSPPDTHFTPPLPRPAAASAALGRAVKRGTSDPGYNVAVTYNPNNGFLPAYMPAFAFEGAALTQATQEASLPVHASGAWGACMHLCGCLCGISMHAWGVGSRSTACRLRQWHDALRRDTFCRPAKQSH